MSISDEARKMLDGNMGPVSRILYAQLLGFDGVEQMAGEFGYKVHFEPRTPMVTFYRKVRYPELPWDVEDTFHAIPRRPYWLEESGFIEVRGGLLTKLPETLEGDVIEVLGKFNEEIRLGVYYCRLEAGDEMVNWHGEVNSVQEFSELLRNQPRS